MLVVSCALVRTERYSARRDSQATTAGITTIRIVNGAGHLEVVGRVGSSIVNAAAIVHGSSRKAVDSVKLVLEKSGDVLEVRTQRPEPSWFDRNNPSVDLTVDVPRDLAVDILDGSGRARIDSVGTIRIRSGSGEVHLSDVTGSVDLVSGSGDAELRNVNGDISAMVGSASLGVHGVSGSIDVRNAGSGALTIDNVTGTLHIGTIESGSLFADGIGGDLTVDNRGSSDVKFTNVRGSVSVPLRH